MESRVEQQARSAYAHSRNKRHACNFAGALIAVAVAASICLSSPAKSYNATREKAENQEYICKMGKYSAIDAEHSPAVRKAACDFVLKNNGKNVGLFNVTMQDALYARARAYNALGEHQRALDDINRALKTGTKDLSSLYRLRAFTKITLGQYDSASSDLDLAESEIMALQSHWGPVICKHDAHPDECVKKYDQRVNQREVHGSLGELRGDVSFSKKEYRLAVHFYEAAIKAIKTYNNPDIPLPISKLELAKRLLEAPASPPSNPSAPSAGSPPALPPPCKMYPNLC